MSNIKPHYYVTDQAAKRFKKWLIDKNMSLNEFSKKAGCSRQYLSKILKGQLSVTKTAREWFAKGGYDAL